jgi:transcriptional regulator with XRE-family HTH domain
MTGLSMPTISLLERGMHKAQPATIKKIMMALGIPENEILDSQNENSVAQTHTTPSTMLSSGSKTDLRFPFGLMIGDHRVEISPAVANDIRRLLYWSLQTGILTKDEIEGLLTSTQ